MDVTTATGAGPAPTPDGGPTDPTPPPVPADADADAALVRKLKEMPREVGVMLMTVGVLGWVLPGMVGVPALMAGGLVLWPRKFSRLESWFEGRFPTVHHQSLQQIGRYLDDLERRYPTGPEDRA